MLACESCEYFSRDADGLVHLRCDPFSTVKEPECLHKWNLARQALLSNQLAESLDRQAKMLRELSAIRRAYEATLEHYNRLAPLQEKMMRHMQREIDDIDDADSWKRREDDED